VTFHEHVARSIEHLARTLKRDIRRALCQRCVLTDAAPGDVLCKRCRIIYDEKLDQLHRIREGGW